MEEENKNYTSKNKQEEQKEKNKIRFYTILAIILLCIVTVVLSIF